jgi:hypothetical protein
MAASSLISACGKSDPPASRSPAGSSSAAPAESASKVSPVAPPPAVDPVPLARRFRTTDVSQSSGITLENVCGDPVRKLAIPENLGQGAAALDYDRDGDQDLFVTNGSVFEGQTPRFTPRPALYRNDGGMKFTDVTEAAGISAFGWGHGAFAIDFDADGDQDLYLTCYLRANLWYENRGDGTFRDATAEWGGADPGPSTAAAFFDADLDGDLDLWVGNYVHYDPKAPPNDGNPCEWKGLKVSCGPLGTTPAADSFFENIDGKLVDATKKFGFDAAAPSYALGAVTGDYDGDGDTDLYVANDSRPNFLWRNDRGRFKDVAMMAGVAMNEAGRAQSGMGVDAFDVDHNGALDLFVTNFSHDHNTLYLNDGVQPPGLLFTDESYASKLGEPSFLYLSWGTRVSDLDRDGWPDLVVVSGHVYPQVDSAPLGTSYRQLNQIFAGRGKNEKGLVVFEDVQFAAGDGFLKKAVSRGLLLADFDGDDDEDYFIVELDAPPTLLRNDGEGHGAWVHFDLIGKGKNRDAIGARVVATLPDGTTRLLERSYGGGYLSTSEGRLRLGLGAVSEPLPRVEVRWPLGGVTTLTNLALRTTYLVDEATGKVTGS